MALPKNSPIEIIEVEEDANLRLVSWNQEFLDELKDQYLLKHGQAVLFVNKAQDRFRIVVCFYGMAMLLLPPITDAERKLSLYLVVSQYLRKFSTKYAGMMEYLDAQVEATQVRMDRRAARVKLAKSASQSRRDR